MIILLCDTWNRQIIDAESRSAVTWDGGGGGMESCWMGAKFQFGKMKKFGK